MKNPKISVIIPAHNEEDVIERCIRSVQKQTFQDFEIIVVNDGSTDKTREIIKELMEEDKRIKTRNFEEGHSAAFARNRGAEISKGNILIFLDADTYLNNKTLEEIEKNSAKADAFSFLCESITKKNLSKILTGFIDQTEKSRIKEGVYDKHSKRKPLFFCCKKSSYMKVGGYDENIFYFEDEDFARRFYKENFKTINLELAKQYYELPSTFKGFVRQCKWIGKGINTLPDKDKKNKMKSIWILKSIFLLFPLIFLWNLKVFLTFLVITAGISYFGLIYRNKNPVLSLITLPFLYIKTFLVTFNIIRFWKYRKN